MENNTNNIGSNIPQNTSQVVSEVPPEIPMDKPANKPSLNPKKIVEMYNSLPKITKLMVKIAIGLFGIMFIVMILAALFSKKSSVIIATPTPSPISATPGPQVILNASRYATDSGVLKIESDLNNFQKQLETTDIKQTDLNLPNMDFNINFNQ